MLIWGSFAIAGTPTTQLAIERVDLMPNRPAPFKLKDFKAVARGYDKLVFDFDARGEYLPLIWWDDTKINLPIRTFGMQLRRSGHATSPCRPRKNSILLKAVIVAMHVPTPPIGRSGNHGRPKTDVNSFTSPHFL